MIFDGDDTLWVTEPLYDDARANAAKVVAAAGFDADAWDAQQRTIDVANVTRFGLSAVRFPTSCVEALDAIARAAGVATPAAARQDVWDAASAVFTAVAPLVPGAQETLRTLAARYRLALLTKGDEQVQRRRIAASGLAEHFGVVRVVATKDAGAFRDVQAALGAATCWSVGNSLSSDVVPALEAGMKAIWLDAHVWEYERRTTVVPDGVLVAASLRDVPRLLREAVAAPTR